MWPLKSKQELRFLTWEYTEARLEFKICPQARSVRWKVEQGESGGGGGAACLAKHIKRPLAHNIHSIHTTLLTREDLSQAAHRDFTQGITMFTRSWKYKHTVQTKIFSQIIRCLINIKKIRRLQFYISSLMCARHIPYSSFSFWWKLTREFFLYVET